MFTWNDAFFADYDSPWCVLEKLSWLNVKSPLEILQHIAACRVHPSPCAADSEDSYIDTSWLYVSEFHSRGLPARTARCEELASAINARSGQKVLGFIAPAMLGAQLQVCHACLADGYHSVAHQIAGLQICPIHESPLSKVCPHCKRALPLFSVRGSASQFKCDGCGVSFLKDGLLKPPCAEIRAGERERIKPLIDWIRCASQGPIHWPSWSPEWRFRMDRDDVFCLTTFQASLPHCLNVIYPWRFADQYFGAPTAGLKLVPIGDRKQLCARGRSPGQRGAAESNRACAEMRAFAVIAARASESDLLRRLKAHYSCINDLIAMMASAPNEFEFSANPAMCGVAQSILIWKWRLQTFIHEVGLWARRGWAPVLNESLTNILRIEMESSFYYGATQIAYLQGIPTLTLRQRCAAIRAGHCPCFAEPSEPSHSGKRAADAEYFFQLKDDGIFKMLRCDHGHYRQNRFKDISCYINGMVSSVHSAHTE